MLILTLASLIVANPQPQPVVSSPGVTVSPEQKGWFHLRVRPFQATIQVPGKSETLAPAADTSATPATPTMLCAIRVIEPDPNFDPKMVRPTKKGFDAKIVRPSACRR